MENQRTPISSLMATTGAVTAIFSLVVTALILSNIIPGFCSFVSGLQLVFLAFLFVLGSLAFFFGRAISRGRR